MAKIWKAAAEIKRVYDEIYLLIISIIKNTLITLNNVLPKNIVFNTLFRWVIHAGLLHLLGYDHETSQEDEEEMFALQEKILKKLVDYGTGWKISR